MISLKWETCLSQSFVIVVTLVVVVVVAVLVLALVRKIMVKS